MARKLTSDDEVFVPENHGSLSDLSDGDEDYGGDDTAYLGDLYGRGGVGFRKALKRSSVRRSTSRRLSEDFEPDVFDREWVD